MRPVGADGAGVDAADALAVLAIGDLDVRVLAPFLGQDLDAGVDDFVGRVVVAIHLAIQIDRRRRGRLRLARHLQVFR